MAIIRWKEPSWNLVDEYDRLRSQINQLFEGPAFPVTQGLFDRSVSPALDLIEGDESFTVVCDLPGVDKKNLDVSIAQDVLTIKGEKSLKADLEKANVYKNECWEGKFQRTISLPKAVDGSKIDAVFKNGVLRLTLPKREEARARKIELKS